MTESQDESDTITWAIRSQESGTVWMNNTFTFELDYTHSLGQHLILFKELVRQIVPLEYLSEFPATVVEFERILQARDLGEDKPRCRLDLDVREGMKVAVVSKIEPDAGLKEIDTFPVELDDLEYLNELMTMDGGPLTYYDIVNLEEFYDHIQMTLSKRRVGEETEILESEEDSELLCVIAEYREVQDHRGLGHALTSFARLRLSQDRIWDARDAAEEALILLRGCSFNDREVRSDIALVLVVKAEVLLREDTDIKKVEVLLYEARDIVRSLLDTLRPGRTDIIVQKTAEWIERLLLQVDESKNH